jgi:hypothetical protein
VSATDPTQAPPWLREFSNPIEQDPKMDNGASGAYVPGSSPLSTPIWIYPAEGDGHGGVKI